jgi:hypothetical protein
MANGVYVRRDIWALDLQSNDPPWEPYSLGYARAIGVMKQRDPDDPTSLSYQAAMHGSYTQPADPLWNGCQHGSWFFLPWHRMYIWYFERIARAIVLQAGGPADWGLPYWNYTDGPPGSAALPRVFSTPTLPDGTENPLHVPDGNRAAWTNGGTALPGAMTTTVQTMQSTSFSPGFGGLPKDPVHFGSPHGLLESQPHDNIHVALGGNATQVGCQEGWMIDPNCAALDPIFYLHHSNIDRLWVEWLAQGSGRANPSQPQWTGASFSFYDENKNQEGKTCGEVGDIAGMDYVYDDMPAILPVTPGNGAETPPVEEEPARGAAQYSQRAAASGAEAELPKRPGAGPEIASGGGTRLGAEPSVVSLDAPAGAPPILEAARAATEAEGPRIYLHLEDVHTDALPGIVWEVRVDPDGSGGNPEESVGTISFFGRGHAHGEDAGAQAPGVTGERFIFDITEAVRRLEETGRWDESKITVSFHPAMPEGYDEDVPPVSIGRIYITHG